MHIMQAVVEELLQKQCNTTHNERKSESQLAAVVAQLSSDWFLTLHKKKTKFFVVGGGR